MSNYVQRTATAYTVTDVQRAVTSISLPHSSDTGWGRGRANPHKRSTNKRPHLHPHQDKPVVAHQRGAKR